MPPDFSRARALLQACNLPSLFVEELGWEPGRQKLILRVGDDDYALAALAEKRGFTAWLCESPDGRLPDHATRLKLDRALAQTSFEHLIVFVTGDRARQSWMWVRRQPGKLLSARTHEYTRGQPGDSLLQKLQLLFVSLEEEEAGLSVTQIAGRVRAAFDVERITKKFYKEFDSQRQAFLKFIEGIGEATDREWYASVMLNRLMFVYFIQRKGFLDGDSHYLRNRLKGMQSEYGRDRFYSFYRYFLLRLFHEGLGGKKRAPGLEKLLGRIPYLNGGMFDVHELEKPERYGKQIQIPDQAFESIFNYFDHYQWHLDERPLRSDNEINPDVLGYIFEKYINQKQMGAYYTKEDITEYISKNTVIPFLFDAARKECKVAFENPTGPTVWDLLREDPDRYIYPAVRHGAGQPLPPEIAKGLDTSQPNLIERRQGWNRPAPGEYALPTEIWREVVARRLRFEEVKQKLASGQVREINDLITLNLDIRQFAQDVIENSEGPELLRAFWHAIEKVTILDPTCGSGAFLFAALNILEPLYEACLDRMEAFLADLALSGQKHRPEKFSDFRQVLDRMAGHPNRRYFIFKSIILNNLFGVDIMEEAVEICQLRLFLKLAAQVEPDPTKDNLGIEPLPDIDFNIRVGNTLVGYTTLDEIKKSMDGDWIKQLELPRIQEQAEIAGRAFQQFHKMQTEQGMDGKEFVAAKQTLQKQLKVLEDELNQYLAGGYGIRFSSPPGRGAKNERAAFSRWVKSHQPFHWFVEFFGIMQGGGFDVIIGNPPYVVYTPEKVVYEIKIELYATFPCKNLYAFVSERSVQLSHKNSSLGLIVQLTALSSEKMSPLQDLLLRKGLLVAPSFPRRPESIFDGVEMPVTILITRSGNNGMFTSRISRFYTEERPQSMVVLRLAKHNTRVHGHRIGKLGTILEVGIFNKFDAANLFVESLTTASSDHILYYQEACRYWAKACKGYPFFRRNGELMAPPHGRIISFINREACAFVTCLVNSSFFYWFYSAFSDCEHINDTLLRSFKIPDGWNVEDWIIHQSRMSMELKAHSVRKIINTSQGHRIEYDELDASKSKPILDEIDRVLVRHYGFSEEELDFIINYDIKYRMGREGTAPEE